MVIAQSESCGIAFKEWAGVCDALFEGRQSILIRKGGISEGAGPGRFVPEYSEFWLYPTRVHQAEQGLRQEPAKPPTVQPSGPRADGSIPILGLVHVDWIGRVENENTLPALEEFHCLTCETILKRYHYRKPGLWVLGARVWLRDSAMLVVATSEHTGCKTWVILDQPIPTSALSPVLDEKQWSEHQRRLRSILASDH
jgi:hypothetical protein